MTAYTIELPTRIYNVELLDAEMRDTVPGFTGLSTRGNKIFACIDVSQSENDELKQQLAEISDQHNPALKTREQEKQVARRALKQSAIEEAEKRPNDPLAQALKALLEKMDL